MDCLHIGPFRTPLTINWNYISEYPDRAAQALEVCAEKSNKIAGVSVEIGYPRIYTGGAVFDEVTVDRLPACFSPALIIRGQEEFDATAALIERGFPEDKVRKAGITVSSPAFYLYGFNTGAFQFITQVDDSIAIKGAAGEIGLALAQAIERRYASRIASIIGHLQNANVDKGKGDVHLAPPADVMATEAMKMLRYDAKSSGVLWVHRTYFVQDEDDMDLLEKAGAGFAGLAPIDLPLAGGAKMIPTDGRSAFFCSPEQFFENRMDWPARDAQVLYVYFDALRQISDIARLRLSRAGNRSQVSAIADIIRHTDELRDDLTLSLPFYDAAYKHPRQAVKQAYEKAFRLDAVVSSAAVAVDASEKKLAVAEQGFSQRVQRRSQSALFVISFLGVLSLLTQLLSYAKGKYDPHIDKLPFAPGFSLLEVMRAMSSDLYILGATAATIIIALYFLRRS